MGEPFPAWIVIDDSGERFAADAAMKGTMPATPSASSTCVLRLEKDSCYMARPVCESATGDVLVTATLHYIHDPLCGWCYGAEPLVRAAADVAELALVLHAGGLWPQPTTLPPEMRRYIQQADTRIAQMSGQPFGQAYLSGSLLDATLVLHSRPTIAAVLAAQTLDPGKALPMLRGIQHAHYEQGQRVVEREVLCDIAEACGLSRAEFAAALDTVAVDAHIAATRELMGRVGSGGFPTFVLQIGETLVGVPHQRFASSPAEFQAWLRRQIAAQARAAATH